LPGLRRSLRFGEDLLEVGDAGEDGGNRHEAQPDGIGE